MDVSTKDCVTFYTSNTIITVTSGLNANEPLQDKNGKENKLKGIKFSCLHGVKMDRIFFFFALPRHVPQVSVSTQCPKRAPPCQAGVSWL